MFNKIIDVNIFRWRLAVTAQARISGGNERPLPERNQVKQMGKRARNKIRSVDKVRNPE